VVTNARFIFFPFFLSDKFLSGIFQIFLNFRAGAYNQVGKTTFIKHILQGKADYVEFDPIS
jgi:hypothetical protein